MPAPYKGVCSEPRAKTKAEKEVIFNNYIDALLKHERPYPRRLTRLYVDGSGRKDMFIPLLINQLTITHIKKILKANGGRQLPGSIWPTRLMVFFPKQISSYMETSVGA